MAQQVSDPKDYRFSGYAEACGGGSKARDGVATIFENYSQRQQGWAKAGSMYREQLFVRGEETRRKDGFAHETVKAVLEGGGKLTAAQALHCRVRYFTDGVVLGCKAFVEDVFERNCQPRGRSAKKRADSAWKRQEVVNQSPVCTVHLTNGEPVLFRRWMRRGLSLFYSLK